MMDGRVFVKVKAPNARFFSFLTHSGFVNFHRSRAAQFVNEEQAQAFIDSAAPDNPGWQWKIVPVNHSVGKGGRPRRVL